MRARSMMRLIGFMGYSVTVAKDGETVLETVAVRFQHVGFHESLIRISPWNLEPSHVVFVLIEQAHGLSECIATERIPELARTHDLDDGGLAVIHLQVDGTFERRPHLLELIHYDAFGAHRLGDLRKALVIQLSCNEAPVVEVDLILLLCAPLPVMKHHRRRRHRTPPAGGVPPPSPR